MPGKETNQETVIELNGPNLLYAQEAFAKSFPQERDRLLGRIPEIRHQMEAWNLEDEEESEPPQYLRVTREEAVDLAELLDCIAGGTRGSHETADVAAQIRSELGEADEADPDDRTLLGRRFGWTEPDDSKPPALLVSVLNQAELRHPRRMERARVGLEGIDSPIYRVEVPETELAALKASKGCPREEFDVRIEADGSLTLRNAARTGSAR